MRMDRVTTPLAYSSSGTLVIYGVQLSDVALVVGILTGLGTFVINWYYQAKRSRNVKD